MFFFLTRFYFYSLHLNTHLYFRLLAFPKQTCYFSFNAFGGNHGLFNIFALLHTTSVHTCTAEAARLCSPLPGFSYIHIFFAVLQTLYEPEILVFDIMGIRLNNQLSLWCVYKQLRQIVLIVPLSNRTVLHLYFLHFT